MSHFYSSSSFPCHLSFFYAHLLLSFICYILWIICKHLCEIENDEDAKLITNFTNVIARRGRGRTSIFLLWPAMEAAERREKWNFFRFFFILNFVDWTRISWVFVSRPKLKWSRHTNKIVAHFQPDWRIKLKLEWTLEAGESKEKGEIATKQQEGRQFSRTSQSSP